MPPSLAGLTRILSAGGGRPSSPSAAPLGAGTAIGGATPTRCRGNSNSGGGVGRNRSSPRNDNAEPDGSGTFAPGSVGRPKVRDRRASEIRGTVGPPVARRRHPVVDSRR
jgi:hypothetical protein